MLREYMERAEQPSTVNPPVRTLGLACAARGLIWFRFPIEDERAPEDAFISAWEAQRAVVRGLLDAGRTIAIHGKGGSGRTGLMAAQILIERGWTNEQAVAAVKRLRPNALSLPAHKDYLARLPCALLGESPPGGRGVGLMDG